MAEPDTVKADRDRPRAAAARRPDWQRIADGVFLMGLGVFVLLNTTGQLPWTFWYDALTLWPIVIVSAGLRIAVERSRVAWLMVLGPLAILATLAAVASGRLDTAPGPWLPVSVARADDAHRLTLRAAFASSRLDVTARALDGGTLVDGRQGSRESKALVETKLEGGDATVTLQAGSHGWDSLRPGRQSRWELGVPATLPLKIDMDGALIGARFDLAQGSLEGGSFDGAFLGLDLHLPRPKARVKLQIHGVFNMVDVFVPAGTPIRVHGPGFPFNLVERGSGDPKDPATPGYDVEFAGVFSRVGVNEEKAAP
jgi:hypothetical protein